MTTFATCGPVVNPGATPMYLAYFDESGDSGLVNSPTRYFVLACVLVHETDWLASLDTLVALRRRLKDKWSIPTRGEIKSTDLRRGRGLLYPLRLSPDARMKLFRGVMGYQRLDMPQLTTFAVAIEKAGAAAKGNGDIRAVAWDYALQRVDRFCSEATERAMIFPDEGHGLFIKRLIRRKRRFSTVPQRWGGGTFKLPLERIVEDPNDRQSHDSYFTQLADWNAFAAHRSGYIDPMPNVDPALWDELGDRRLLAVNKLTGGPPGIKVYP